MTLASGSPFYLSKIPSGLATITFTPPTATAPQEFLYVSNNLDICTQNCVLPQHSDNTVSAYTVSSSGTLTEQPYSPYVVAAVNPVSVMPVYTNLPGTNSGGLYVYVGNSSPSGGGVNPFYVCTVQNPICPLEQDVQNNLMTPLVQVCGTPPCNPVPPTSVGSNPLQMLADPTNNFLYVLSEGSNQVFAFRISPSAGTLTALAPPNQPTGSQPVSMAIHAAVNVQGRPFTSRATVSLHLEHNGKLDLWFLDQRHEWIDVQSALRDLSGSAQRHNRALEIIEASNHLVIGSGPNQIVE